MVPSSNVSALMFKAVPLIPRSHQCLVHSLRSQSLLQYPFCISPLICIETGAPQLAPAAACAAWLNAAHHVLAGSPQPAKEVAPGPDRHAAAAAALQHLGWQVAVGAAAKRRGHSGSAPLPAPAAGLFGYRVAGQGRPTSLCGRLDFPALSHCHLCTCSPTLPASSDEQPACSISFDEQQCFFSA